MHFQLIRELTIVQRSSCLSRGLGKRCWGSFIAVLMQLFMSALAKSHTETLQVLFSYSPDREGNIKVCGSELEELSQPELYVL